MDHKRKRLSLSVLVVAALAMSGIACRPRPSTPSAATVPIVFVHGFYGSGDQYRAMAQYFASNGYDPERIVAFDHNSTGGSINGVPTQRGLDTFIDATRRKFNVSKVQLVGHSMGTMVSATYLGNAGQAAKVEKYVSTDGAGCAVVTSVPCLNVAARDLRAWGGNNTQTHVESSASPESFARQYQFFLGRAPSVTRVVPENSPTIRLAGRLQELTVNTPIANQEIEFWEVDGDTGHRISNAPTATATTGADGFFSGVTVPQGKPYEVAVSRPNQGALHAYYQPFMRSDLLLRINTTSPTSQASTSTNRGAGHSSVAIVRNREFWRNHGGQSDVLKVKSTGQDEVDLLRGFTGSGDQYVGIHIHDNAATPRQSTLQPLPYFSTQPFQTGMDVYMPASSPPDGTITITNLPRGDASKPQVVNIANWPSDANGMSVHLNDWV